MRDRDNRDVAIILAAGYSTRMGTCKSTLPWHNGQSLLPYQAEQFLEAGITPTIVLGSHNAHVRADCPQASRVVINRHCDRGKTSSILTGLESLPQDISTITISAVDQPRSTDIYRVLLQAHRNTKALITVACYREKLGHPMIFSYQILPELQKIEEATFGLRRVVRQFYSKLNKVGFTTPEVIVDLNTFTEYQLELQKKQLPKIRLN